MYLHNEYSLCVKLCAVNCFLSHIVQCYHAPLLSVGNKDDILMEEKIIPDVLNKRPTYIAEVNYDNVTLPNFGNVISKKSYERQPESIKWMPDCNLYYTIIFTDIDANPNWPRRERQLWILGNILGESWKKGDEITSYGISEPAKGSGKHRVLIVIYEHSNKIGFKEPKISNRNDERRNNFSTLEFVKRYNMNRPNAANYFSIEYEG